MVEADGRRAESSGEAGRRAQARAQGRAPGGARCLFRPSPSAGASTRLSVFSPTAVEAVADRLRERGPREWPPLAGVLCVIFTSRSGSTLLAREAEHVFAIGEVREALNPPVRATGRVLSAAEGGWFGLKAGGPGVVAGELTGFFDAYLDTTRFVRVLRRDIVAQAISREIAVQTERYHSNQKARGEATYDGAAIGRRIRRIAGAVERLEAWLDRAERPYRTLIYEEFAGGDFSSALRTLEASELPRRLGPHDAYRPVERMSDGRNREWAARFAEEADSAAVGAMASYAAFVARAESVGAPASSRRDGGDQAPSGTDEAVPDAV